ncbi:hypothetical protein SO802_019752 [Lithocarpus litseifolius]|uniref:Uncharacterized protein n=1 Tax=Lithocarpus litseifolius TaxID=425828 RepID=A0AAW2CPM0_9ROSI
MADYEDYEVVSFPDFHEFTRQFEEEDEKGKGKSNPNIHQKTKAKSDPNIDCIPHSFSSNSYSFSQPPTSTPAPISPFAFELNNPFKSCQEPKWILETQGTNFEFVRLVKIQLVPSSGIMYFIQFEAKPSSTEDTLKTFEGSMFDDYVHPHRLWPMSCKLLGPNSQWYSNVKGDAVVIMTIFLVYVRLLTWLLSFSYPLLIRMCISFVTLTLTLETRCPACRNYKPHYERVARLFNGPDAVHPGIILMTRVDCALKRCFRSLFPKLVSQKQCYGYHSVPAGMAGKFRTGKQTGTASPSIPPRVRFRPVPVCFGSSVLFRLISPEIKDSAGMSLLHIKLNLGVLDLQNRPKSIPSFLSTNTL